MLALGLLLNIAGLGVFCWLIFTLAVYALPFFVAINAGILAFHSGAGVFGTPLVAVAAGGVTLAMAQVAFAMTGSLMLRAIIAGAFALPATFLPATTSRLRWRTSECLRSFGRRSLLASARSSSVVRHGCV